MPDSWSGCTKTYSTTTLNDSRQEVLWQDQSKEKVEVKEEEGKYEMLEKEVEEV